MTSHLTPSIISRQRPLGSGFTAADTADEVLTGIDLTGWNVIVTGGHHGIGRETTRALASAGATVTVGARDPESAAAELSGVERVRTSRLDLMDPDSVDAFVARFLDTGRPLDVLINNAGLMGGPLVRDARGYEAQFATNHLGHFQLTLGLSPALRSSGSARVVTLTSGGHRLSDIRWEDPHFQDGYDEMGMLGYGQSKTANVLFTVELDRRWAEDGIRGYTVHPGIIVTTNLGPARGAGAAPVERDAEQLRAQGLIDADGGPIIDPENERKTVQQGASTSVFAATSPLLADIGGVYLKDNDLSVLDSDPQPMDFATETTPQATVVPHALDPESARRLWDLSLELLGRSEEQA